MAAEDPSESTAIATDPAWASPRSERSAALPPAVLGWLDARVRVPHGEVVLAVAVQPGRWIFRVEWGSVSSLMELPATEDHSIHDVVAALRRWARSANVGARFETLRGEARAVLSTTATRS